MTAEASATSAAAAARRAPRRICMVLEHHLEAGMGGAEYQAHLLATELASRAGVEVTYLARSAPDSPQANAYPYAIRSIGNAGGIRQRAVLFDARPLWDTLCALRPHLIYQRCRQSYTAVCSEYGRRFGAPFVFHIAGESDLLPGWRLMRLSRNAGFDFLESMAGAWGLRHATGVIAQTQRQRRLLQQRFHRQALAVIANFQPLPRELPAKSARGLRVLWVGNVKPVKRAELFVELARQFAHRDDIEFVLIGRRPPRSSLDRLQRQMAALPRLRLTGELSLAEVNAALDEADILVNTSTYEGFPNTFIQAWARGVVVTSLSFDVDGGLDAQGIGCHAGSMGRLGEIIGRLAQDRAQRRAIAERAFAFVQRHHSLASAARLADLLVSLSSGIRTSGTA